MTDRTIASPRHGCWRGCTGRRCWSPILARGRRLIRADRPIGRGSRRPAGQRVATAGCQRVATAGWQRVATADDMADPELDDTLASWRAGAGVVAPRGPVHGDFYRRNILDCDGRLALLDWDEARIDAVSVELAWSVWEFGHSGSALDPARARGFLDEYRRAGGPPYDTGMIVPFIRDRLRWEVARSRSAAAVGEYHDLAYEADEVRAFAMLRGMTLIDQEP